MIKATNVVSGTQFNFFAEQRQTRNPPLQRPRRAEHFVDRERELERVLADLKPGRVVSICGPGGMGKTDLVAEVIWTLAPGDTPPSAFSDGVFFHSFYGQPQVVIALEQLARVLGEEPLPTPALAVQRALSGKHFLLVLDGAEEADQLEQLLSSCADCAVLMTTRKRADAPDPVYRLDLQPLPQEEAVSVVQAFGGRRATNAKVTSEICEQVGNLPLALCLVGRYLSQQEEEASEFLTWLQHSPLAALDQGTSSRQSVVVLLERSTSRLNIQAQRVLATFGLFALAPLERKVLAEVLELTPVVIGQALGELVNYGLLVRQQSRYYVSHPLIHAYAHEVLLSRDELGRQRALAERMIEVLQGEFPEVEYANWARCEELLPHVQACASLIEQEHIVVPEAAWLLNQAGWYLRERAQYTQAELLLQQALLLAEQASDATVAELGSILNNLVLLYRVQGQYAQAIPYGQRALDFVERTYGTDHPHTAATLNNLAGLYLEQGRYEKAEPFYQRALVITEQALPADHPDTANTLDNLAGIYQAQGRYEEAEPLYQRVLISSERIFGPDHPATSSILYTLGLLYKAQGKYSQAEPLLRRALTIDERAFEANHPIVVSVTNSYSDLLQKMKYERKFITPNIQKDLHTASRPKSDEEINQQHFDHPLRTGEQKTSSIPPKEHASRNPGSANRATLSKTTRLIELNAR